MLMTAFAMPVPRYGIPAQTRCCALIGLSDRATQDAGTTKRWSAEGVAPAVCLS